MALILGLLGGWLPLAAPARAGAIVVTTLADPSGPTGTCSLRSAITAANSDSDVGGCTGATSGPDMITFAPGLTGTITLLAGEFQISSGVTIEGPGTDLLTISGGGTTRIFDLYGESPEPIELTLIDLTVADGSAEYDGGAVVTNPNTSLTLQRVVMSGNSARGGGAIAMGFGSSLVVIDSAISGNTATQYNGGGIALEGGSLVMRGSTVSGNQTLGDGEGGFGGGLFINGNGGAAIANSTFANNTANQGSGIAVITASANLTHVTVAGSTTGGSALYAQGEGASIGFRSTIVANAIQNCAAAFDGIIEAQEESLQYNSANPTDASCGASLPIANPLLGLLGDNGGLTPTMLPGGGSPAINIGDANCEAKGVDGLDQRGVTRPQGAACDSGAVEVAIADPTLTALATSPDPVVTGAGGTVTLTLDGTNFVQNLSVVQIDGLATINGGAITTTYVSPTRLTATFPAFPTGTARSYAVTVSNAPYAGTSNALPFSVQNPTQSPTVRASVEGGGGTISPVGDTTYPTGGQATYIANPDEGQVFLGWTLDGQYVGFPSPLTFTVNNDRTLVARFVPRHDFSDVPPPGVAWEGITQLAARGIINGYQPEVCAARDLAAPCFGPNDPVARAQIAALIVRTFGWDNENPGGPAPFVDLDGLDAELQRAVAILAERGIVVGYGDGTYGPLDGVTHEQAISVITRSMVQAGYWTAVIQDDPTAYPEVPTSSPHRLDLLTYFANAGNPPERPNGAGWGSGASRTWTAQALWQAYRAYFGVDRVP